MGLRSSAYICQRLSYIMGESGCGLLNYLDDFVGAERSVNAMAACETLPTVLDRLGLRESPTRHVPPIPSHELPRGSL